MISYFKGLFYRVLIDPLLSGVRKIMLESINNSSSVIDIACGTGTMAIKLGRRVKKVLAIDLDEDMIRYAGKRAARKRLLNISFESRDASDLSMFKDKEFDVAVTSMSVHQFEADLAVRILSEMKRVASEVIIADYHYPLPGNLAGILAGNIERMAGGDHYRNFRTYIDSGGLKYFTDRAGIDITSEGKSGYGVFIVAKGAGAAIQPSAGNS
jgi:SAM-dependent methyltransferase